MKEFTEEEIIEFSKRIGENVLNLGIYFKSLKLSSEEMKFTVCLFLASYLKATEGDEEDLREIFRLISVMKDRVMFV